VFCDLPVERILAETPLTRTLLDSFPVSPGHTLIVTRRHVETWFDARAEEQTEILAAIAKAKAALDQSHHPDGYNIGTNAGAASGQTVMHLHVHVIPRFKGDVPDPRGGVRWVVPSKAAYWKKESSES
jgi:diadenosine tetraphosphate (Ap4A) HIT family hydrolase